MVILKIGSIPLSRLGKVYESDEARSQHQYHLTRTEQRRSNSNVTSSKDTRRHQSRSSSTTRYHVHWQTRCSLPSLLSFRDYSCMHGGPTDVGSLDKHSLWRQNQVSALSRFTAPTSHSERNRGNRATRQGFEATHLRKYASMHVSILKPQQLRKVRF